jgi:hypothetical protein
VQIVEWALFCSSVASSVSSAADFVTGMNSPDFTNEIESPVLMFASTSSSDWSTQLLYHQRPLRQQIRQDFVEALLQEIR